MMGVSQNISTILGKKCSQHIDCALPNLQCSSFGECICEIDTGYHGKTCSNTSPLTQFARFTETTKGITILLLLVLGLKICRAYTRSPKYFGPKKKLPNEKRFKRRDQVLILNCFYNIIVLIGSIGHLCTLTVDPANNYGKLLKFYFIGTQFLVMAVALHALGLTWAEVAAKVANIEFLKNHYTKIRQGVFVVSLLEFLIGILLFFFLDVPLEVGVACILVILLCGLICLVLSARSLTQTMLRPGASSIIILEAKAIQTVQKRIAFFFVLYGCSFFNLGFWKTRNGWLYNFAKLGFAVSNIGLQISLFVYLDGRGRVLPFARQREVCPKNDNIINVQQQYLNEADSS